MDAELKETSFSMNLHLAQCPQLLEKVFFYFLFMLSGRFLSPLAMPQDLASQMDEQNEALRRNTPIPTF